MIVGTVKETKPEETRIGLIPSTVAKLKKKGCQILIEKGAGLLAGIKDDAFKDAGAKIVSSPKEVWQKAELIVKVKEPQESEYCFLRKGQIIFTYFHFASNNTMTEILLKKEVTCIAYELVRHDNSLPLLTPMSEIAGRLAAQEGARYLESGTGGKGVLLAGANGVHPGRVVIIGAGVAGVHAARIAAGLGAEIALLDVNLERLRYLETILPFDCRLVYSNRENLLEEIKTADLIIGAVLIPGAAAPKIFLKNDLKFLEKGTVLVDIAIDQGGCFETSRPTRHSQPVYDLEGIIHYCVPNMPAAVSKTSTYALNYATAPYIITLAETNGKLPDLDEEDALQAGLKFGLALHQGKVMNETLLISH